MDLTTQLRLWGTAHAEARAAESAARLLGGRVGELTPEARALRERADRLHREIYRALGAKEASAQG